MSHEDVTSPGFVLVCVIVVTMVFVCVCVCVVFSLLFNVHTKCAFMVFIVDIIISSLCL